MKDGSLDNELTNGNYSQNSIEQEIEQVQPRCSKYKGSLIGIGFCLGISLASVCNTQFGKSIFSESFDAALFSVSFSVSFITSIFPIYYILTSIKNSTRSRWKELFYHILEIYDTKVSTFDNTSQKYKYCTKPRFLFKMLGIMLFFSALYIGANYSFTKALQFINPSENTAIFSSSNVFVFILSILILKSRFYVTKFVCVAFCTTGIILMFYSGRVEKLQITGMTLSLVSSLLASLYKVLYKKIIKSGDLSQVSFFLTSIGIIDLLIMPVIIYILHITNAEILPNISSFPWSSIVGKACFALIFDFLLNFGIAKTNPLFISIGAILAYPINAVVDYVMGRSQQSFLNWIGVGFILASVVIILIPEQIYLPYEDRLRKSSCSRHGKKSHSSVECSENELL